MKKGNLFVFSGPSGSGKTTLAKEIAGRSTNIKFVISYTTRVKRDGEVDGRDYHFVGQQEFESMKEKGEFAEWAEVFGNYYGTPLERVNELLDSGKDVLLEIDVKGAKQIREKFNHSIHIFILAPDIEELQQRLVKRRTDSDKEINRRLNLAGKEMDERNNYDYIITNKDLDQTLAEIKRIIETENNNNYS